jgi:universal bacterial protein yeaZ
MHSAPGLVVAGAPIPVHSSSALARADLGPQVELDPAVMSRLVATRLAHGQGDRLRTDPLYLRRPDIQGQPAARL